MFAISRRPSCTPLSVDVHLSTSPSMLSGSTRIENIVASKMIFVLSRRKQGDFFISLKISSVTLLSKWNKDRRQRLYLICASICVRNMPFPSILSRSWTKNEMTRSRKRSLYISNSSGVFCGHAFGRRLVASKRRLPAVKRDIRRWIFCISVLRILSQMSVRNTSSARQDCTNPSATFSSRWLTHSNTSASEMPPMEMLEVVAALGYSSNRSPMRHSARSGCLLASSLKLLSVKNL